MRLYGRVARFPAGDPAGRILCAREPAGWTRPVGRPHDMWLRQMYRHFAWDGSCVGLEDGHQDTKRVPLSGKQDILKRLKPLATSFTKLYGSSEFLSLIKK